MPKSLRMILDKHIGKVYKDWNEVVKAKQAMRSDISDWLESHKKKPHPKDESYYFNACIDELKKECI